MKMLDNHEDYLMDIEDEDEQSGTKSEHYVIPNDTIADMQIERIKSYELEEQRFINIYQERTRALEDQLNDHLEAIQRRKQAIEEQLQEYFNSLPPEKIKKSKMQSSYPLLSGVLKSKKQNPEFKVDKDRLLAWTKQRAPDYVRISEEAMWGELKKITMIDGDNVCLAIDGDRIDGVTVVQRPNKFTIE